LTKEAKRTDSEAAAGLRSRVEELLADVPPEWQRRRELATLGEFWAALAVYDLAAEALDQVQRDWSAVARLKDLETLANIKAKWAVQLTVEGSTDAGAPTPACLLREADHIVKRLIDLGPTPERLWLRGSVARRRARCAPTPAEVTAELKRARRAYSRAAALHERQTGRVDTYAALNAALVGWQVAAREPGTAFDRACADALRQRDEQSDSGPGLNFWERVAGADLALADALFHQRLPEDLEKVVEHYRSAFARSSTSERMSVVEHIEMIGAALPGGSNEVGNALADLRGRLQEWRP
jgi:hypothetical protein